MPGIKFEEQVVVQERETVDDGKKLTNGGNNKMKLLKIK